MSLATCHRSRDLGASVISKRPAGGFPLVDEESDDPIVAPVFGRLKQRWGTVLNIYRVLGWSPQLVKAWSSFAWSMRFDLNASRRLRELLVIRIASLLGAEYEYQHHLAMALDEGVSPEQVTDLSEWRTSAKFDATDKAVLAMADELALGTGASADTMASLRRTLGERDTVELMVTGSFYCGVARIINSAQVQLEPHHGDLRARNIDPDTAT
ncbi:carboxymuconolactone decarboxylase family protein [Pseudomonas sp.]|uniref:carboxymuconolactone decarboxylase family protein n=1 Tax=Pseudomonas sp. TaxID=306 RepID=UPI003D130D7C